ncbi:hypothetical protein J3P80_01720 [Pseudomonas sp. D2-30]|uniref:hypothetical protein n=1 Tax=unclassified Pseudomonas TaxID=196821 RepID=UPI001CBC6C73|nr:hypothetical protein [Pseudomonas sp. GL-B-16]
MFKELIDSYKGTIELWAEFWSLYGGIRSLVVSIYFGGAIIITMLSFGLWTKPGWWDIVIGAIPTLLGFTLAGLAVFMSMDSGFSKIIAGGSKPKSPSPFLSLISSFVHFILVQTIALFYALISKSLSFTLPNMPEWYYRIMSFMTPVAGAIGFLIFIYAIMLVVAATFSIFRSSKWFEAYIDQLNTETDSNKGP